MKSVIYEYMTIVNSVASLQYVGSGALLCGRAAAGPGKWPPGMPIDGETGKHPLRVKYREYGRGGGQNVSQTFG